MHINKSERTFCEGIQISMREVQGKSKKVLISNIVDYCPKEAF